MGNSLVHVFITIGVGRLLMPSDKVSNRKRFSCFLAGAHPRQSCHKRAVHFAVVRVRVCIHSKAAYIKTYVWTRVLQLSNKHCCLAGQLLDFSHKSQILTGSHFELGRLEQKLNSLLNTIPELKQELQPRDLRTAVVWPRAVTSSISNARERCPSFNDDVFRGKSQYTRVVYMINVRLCGLGRVVHRREISVSALVEGRFDAWTGRSTPEEHRLSGGIVWRRRGHQLPERDSNFWFMMVPAAAASK